MMARTGDSRWLFDWTLPGPRLQAPVKVNQWNHVVVTRRSDTYTMWMNGQRATSQVAAGDISDTGDTSPFLVGGFMFDDGVHEKFQGDLDQFRIFHRCLSDAEILALYSRDGLEGSVSLLPRESSALASHDFQGGPPAVESVAPAAPRAHALHFDRGHVSLGGRQLTTGATSISLWYQYQGYTGQCPLLVDLKAGSLAGMFVSLNRNGDPGDGTQIVSINNRGGFKTNSFEGSFVPTAWNHLVCTYDGNDPVRCPRLRDLRQRPIARPDR